MGRVRGLEKYLGKDQARGHLGSDLLPCEVTCLGKEKTQAAWRHGGQWRGDSQC